MLQQVSLDSTLSTVSLKVFAAESHALGHQALCCSETRHKEAPNVSVPPELDTSRYIGRGDLSQRLIKDSIAGRPGIL